MKIVALLPLCLLLTACQTTGPLDENSPSHLLPSGSRLVLKQELTIPAHSVSILLQGGHEVSNRDLERYQPHCRLEIQDMREIAQVVTADEFVVRRAFRDTKSSARTGLMKTALRYAAEGPTYFVFRTVLDLHSERQPQVRSLTCQQWGNPGTGRHLSIREIRQALGEIFTLYLPDATPGERQ